MSFDSSPYEDETFTDLELPEARLEDSVFYDCRFERCGLSGASLRRSRFISCTFSQSDLSLADLTDAELSDVTFEHTALVGVNFSPLARTRLLPLELRFDTCVLTHTTFRELDLSGSTLEDCLLREAEFRAVKLVGSSLVGSDLSNAVFYDCDLTGADLRGAREYQIGVTENRVKGLRASFPEALGLLAGLGIELS